MGKLTIALATCEGATFLDDQLASYVSQTRLPDELVVSDDASSDHTWEILSSFAVVAPFPVRLMRNEQRRGYSANFAQVIDMADGDLIALSDQDDVWLATKLARLEATWQAQGCHLLAHDLVYVDENLESDGETKLGRLRTTGHSSAGLTSGCATAVTRQLIDLARPLPEWMPYDRWLHSVADYSGVRIVLEEPLSLWRRHGAAASRESLHNTLVPLPRWQVLVRSARQSWAKPSRVTVAERMRWMQTFIQRADVFLADHEGSRDELSEAVREARKRAERDSIELQKRSRAVETRGLIRRAGAITRYFARGGYASQSKHVAGRVGRAAKDLMQP